jgi:hypothetical protein
VFLWGEIDNGILIALPKSAIIRFRGSNEKKQATQSLIPPNIRKISNTITDIAGKADIILQGGDIGKPAKKSNAWIQHVKEFEKENGMTYFKALSDPRCKSQYRKVIGDGIGSSRVSQDPNISKEKTQAIHTALTLKQKREAYDRELNEFLAFERLSDSQKDRVDARDLLKQNLRDQILNQRMMTENRRQEFRRQRNR